MLKKVLIQCQFGSPHSWSEPYFEHFLRLEQYGWFMKVFTPNDWPSRGNLEFVKMTVEEYDQLLFEGTGVRANNYLKNGVPAKLISDHYVAWGAVFQRYIKDFDFWGITNFDVVYGRLDHFLADSWADVETAGKEGRELPRFVLGDCDVFADEVNGINGIFTLFRNNEHVNNLFRHVPDWQYSFTVHKPCAFDEYQMTHAVRKLAAEGAVRMPHPAYFPLHSYDRLPQHQPKPNLYVEPDGALIERYNDQVHFPNQKGCYGREIFMFHFSKTKVWPL